MHINRIVEDALSEEAVELLNTLVAHAIVNAGEDTLAVFTMPIEDSMWNSTMLMVREIFEAEILIADEPDWLSFRILQSLGAKDGLLAYQFTPTFAQSLPAKK